MPIFITPGEEEIVVHGTAAQHAIFGAFVTLINSESGDDWKDYELSEGKLEDLTELMVRSDVPVLVRPQDDGLA